jgi:hypothetical protein
MELSKTTVVLHMLFTGVAWGKTIVRQDEHANRINTTNAQRPWCLKAVESTFNPLGNFACLFILQYPLLRTVVRNFFFHQVVIVVV